jgi:hypothetical protein
LPLVALVGKGVCFDTGGLDLKTAQGMKLMKKVRRHAWSHITCLTHPGVITPLRSQQEACRGDTFTG